MTRPPTSGNLDSLIWIISSAAATQDSFIKLYCEEQQKIHVIDYYSIDIWDGQSGTGNIYILNYLQNEKLYSKSSINAFI